MKDYKYNPPELQRPDIVGTFLYGYYSELKGMGVTEGISRVYEFLEDLDDKDLPFAVSDLAVAFLDAGSLVEGEFLFTIYRDQLEWGTDPTLFKKLLSSYTMQRMQADLKAQIYPSWCSELGTLDNMVSIGFRLFSYLGVDRFAVVLEPDMAKPEYKEAIYPATVLRDRIEDWLEENYPPVKGSDGKKVPNPDTPFRVSGNGHGDKVVLNRM